MCICKRKGIEIEHCSDQYLYFAYPRNKAMICGYYEPYEKKAKKEGEE